MVSNKFLVSLLMIAIAVSAIGTFVSVFNLERFITGLAAQTNGTAQLNILEQVVVNVTQPTIDFGNITVPAGQTNCYLDTEAGSTDCTQAGGTFGADSSFVFENIGNVAINVSVQSGKLVGGFLGSSSYGAAYQWKCRTKTGTGSPVISSYENVNNASAQLCYANMDVSSSPGEDTAYLDIKLIVPSDAPPGAKSDTITFTAAKA